MNNPPPLQSRIIMRTSLFISLLFHLLTLLALQGAFPTYQIGEELRTYVVELIRPPVEDMQNGEIPEIDIARIEEEEKLSPDDKQHTISLDTEDKRYVAYAKIIKERIGQRWRYPPEAIERLLEGRLMVFFSLTREGNMIRIKIIQNSGHEILDEEALRAVRTASPFPPFPEHIRVSRLNIKATFDYRLGKRE